MNNICALLTFWFTFTTLAPLNTHVRIGEIAPAPVASAPAALARI